MFCLNMLKSKLVTFEVISFLSLISTTASLNINGSELLVELGPKQMYRFSGIGNQEVLHWPVFPSTSRFILRFSGTVNETGDGISVHCPDVNITAIVRRQAIPLSNPRGAVIPDNTFIHTDGVVYSGNLSVSLSTPGKAHDVEVVLDKSENGHYFAALFLPYDSERIDVAGLTKDCHYYVTLKVYAFNATNFTYNAVIDKNVNRTKLTRKQSNIFAVSYMPSTNIFDLSSNNATSLTWDVYSVTDSGGTLQVVMKSLKPDNFDPEILALTNATVYGCLINEFSENTENCTGDLLKLNHSLVGKEMQWYVPFPVAGTWSLEVWFQCECESGNCSDIVQTVEISVGIGTCIENCQSHLKHGYCGLYRTIDVMFMACGCKAGWMGLSCNDGRYALSYSVQILHTLLLTLSNLMFIPCVILAIYRKYYTEAIVYFFVSFMSTFYHACDQPGVVVYCLLPYDTLQFCDFLGSILAIWFTLIALAKFPDVLESWLHVLGCLGVSVAVSYKRFNLWTTVVPAILGVAFVAIKWGLKCHETKHCYPGRRKTLFSIVPGVVCAGVGLCLYAFVETSDNYYIVHSIWHILMASAVLFLLPVKPRNESKDSYNLMKSTTSAYGSFPFSATNRVHTLGSLPHQGSNTSLNL